MDYFSKHYNHFDSDGESYPSTRERGNGKPSRRQELRRRVRRRVNQKDRQKFEKFLGKNWDSMSIEEIDQVLTMYDR